MGFNDSNVKDLSLCNEDEGKLILRSKNDIDLQLEGKLRVGGNALIMFKTFTFGAAGTSTIRHRTGISCDSFQAAIVGFSTGSADIDESGRDVTLLQVRVIKRAAGLKKPLQWYIDADLKSHPSSGTQKHAKWTVDVMFIRKELCE
jgi:hypothetical protein